MTPIRFGILGAAQITTNAILNPARHSDRATIRAIAARDPERAVAFARENGIEVAHDSYEAVIEDPQVDAVYIPLPNSLHGRWTLAALAAGKHVLCEKPLTANADEARAVAAAAAGSDRVVMEAVHYRYHPLAERMRTIVDSGELGTLQHFEGTMQFSLLDAADIRYNLALAGGALMDLGAYTVHIARLLGGGEEPEVISAEAQQLTPDVDGAMLAHLRFPSGHTATIDCALWTDAPSRVDTRVIGSEGEMFVENPLAPQDFPHRLELKRKIGTEVEKFTTRPTYEFQLDAFLDAVVHGTPVLTTPEDAVATMTVVDAIYRAAGMNPRRPA